MRIGILSLIILCCSTLHVPGQIVEIPDPALKAAIRVALDKPIGEIAVADMEGLTELDVSLEKRGLNAPLIHGLDGIDAAVNLTHLTLSGYSNPASQRVRKNIGEVDFSILRNLTNLKTLELTSNKLTSFAVPEGLTNLTRLSLSCNELTSFIIPEGLNNLESLFLGLNNLTNLTLPNGLTSFTALGLGYNKLTSLTLPEGLTNLAILDLAFNDLTSLTLSEELTSLDALFLGINNLTNLTLPEGLTNLTFLDLRFNHLTSLTLPEDLGSLTTLSLEGNQLISLALPEFMKTSLDTIEGFSKQDVTFYRPLISIRNAELLSSGNIKLTINGPQGKFVVESSANLETWTDEGQVTIDKWQTNFNVSMKSDNPQQFFRVLEMAD